MINNRRCFYTAFLSKTYAMPINSGRCQNREYNPLNPPPTKVCNKCDTEKDRSEFKSVHSNKDGKDNMCCTCRDASNREKGRDRKRRREDDGLFC